jgi:hypothetical protein
VLTKLIADMDVVICGDQTADFHAFLSKVLIRRDLPLSSFLEKVHVALQDEISSLPATLRRSFPPFSNVAEFVDRLADQPNPAAESAITCIAQLTHFIG